MKRSMIVLSIVAMLAVLGCVPDMATTQTWDDELVEITEQGNAEVCFVDSHDEATCVAADDAEPLQAMSVGDCARIDSYKNSFEVADARRHKCPGKN